MRLWHVFAVAFCLVFSSMSGAETAPPQVSIRSAGVLAIGAGSPPLWRIAEPGENIPSKTRVSTSPGEPCCLEMPGAKLYVGESCQFALDADARTVDLEAGRVCLKTEKDTSWSVAHGKHKLLVAGLAKVEITAKSDGALAVSVVAGSATVDGAAVAEKNVAVISPDGKTAVSPLSDKAADYIAEWTADRSVQGLGQLLVQDAQSKSPVRLEIARCRMNVVLQPPAALVQLDQSFFNPYPWQQEGTFVFQLPPGASVCRFAMYVTPTELVEGELIQRDRAVNVYESIVRSRRDPAILEQIGDNLFRMRVFPIPANDVKRILLDFTLPLEPQDGRCRFTLPLLNDLMPIDDFRISGAIRGSTDFDSVRSPTHPGLKLTRADNDSIRLDFEAKDYRPPACFALSFSQKRAGRPEKPAVRIFLAESPVEPRDGKDGQAPPESPPPQKKWLHFMAELPPGNPAERRPVDMLILAETSSHTRGNPALDGMLRAVLDHLRPEDRFRLGCVDAGCRMITHWKPADLGARRTAAEKLQHELRLGSGAVSSVLEDALTRMASPEKGRRRMIVWIGSSFGMDENNAPEAKLPTLLNSLRDAEASFVFLDLNPTPAPSLAQELAVRSSGLALEAGKPQMSPRLFSWLKAGMPDGETIAVTMPKDKNAALYYSQGRLAGESVWVYGRCEPADRLALDVALGQSGQTTPRRLELAIPSDQDDVFVGRFWAQRHLEKLVAQSASLFAGARREQEAAIVKFSQEWSLMSPYTAFLVLEKEDDYARWKIDRELRHRYWKPAEAVTAKPDERWIRNVRSQKKVQERAAEFEAKSKRIREALERGDVVSAMRDLTEFELRDPDRSEERAKLERLFLAAAKQREVLQSLSIRQGLWQPKEMAIARLHFADLGDVGSAPHEDFARWHPYASRLLEPCAVPEKPKSIRDLAALLQRKCGGRVMIDFRALEEAHIPPEKELQALGWGQLSLRCMATHLLELADLELVEEPNRLWITTSDGRRSNRQLTTRFYPVGDLFDVNAVPAASAASNAYFEHDEAARARITARLHRPLSVRFEENEPLPASLKKLGEAIGVPVLVDCRAFEESSLEPDQIRFSPKEKPEWNQVSGKEALNWLLDQKELAYRIVQDSLVITTQDKARATLSTNTRTYSLRGLLLRGDNEPSPGSIYGGFGGLGGFGMGMGGPGGMGGGFGMGMGGMGGMGMGGMAGALGPTAPASGRDAHDADRPARVASVATDGNFSNEQWSPVVSEPVDANPPQRTSNMLSQRGSPGGGFEGEPMIDIITSTVHPTTWDTVGGNGSIVFYDPTLDMVVNQTDDVHEQIELLLAKLRRLPLPKEPELRAKLVWEPTAGGPDFDSLINLITSCVLPTRWDTVGGNDSIAPVEARNALAISAESDLHDRIGELLIRLRRRRIENLGLRPFWDCAAIGRNYSLLSALGNSEGPMASLPWGPPTAESLRALAIRKEPGDGVWSWRRTDGDQKARHAITLRRNGEKTTFEFTGGAVEIEKGKARIAAHELRVVECGLDAETVRQTLDLWLPWFPHRTNEELAVAFEVSTVPPTAEEKRDSLVRLRLAPRWPSVDRLRQRSRATIEMVVSAKTGFLVEWTAKIDGSPTARLRFENAAANGSPAWKTITMEHAAGRVVSTWEVVEAAAAPAAKTQEDYFAIDVAASSAPIRAVFAAMGKGDWTGAAAALKPLLAERPNQPFLLGLWCHAALSDPQIAPREEVLAALRRLAASGSAGFLGLTGRSRLEALSPNERLDVAKAMPADLRSPLDWLNLAQLAADARQPGEVAGCIERALAGGLHEHKRWEAELLRVRSLLDANRAPEAFQRLSAYIQDPKATATAWLPILQHFVARSAVAPSEEILELALSDKRLTGQTRSELLLAQSDLFTGQARRRLRLAAAQALPNGQAMAAFVLGNETEDKCTPAELGELARLADRPELRAEFEALQAERTADSREAANLYWKLFRDNRLDSDSMALEKFEESKQWNRLIEVAEHFLRAGDDLSGYGMTILADAYEAVGRSDDARRARSDSVQIPSRPSREHIIAPPLNPSGRSREDGMM